MTSLKKDTAPGHFCMGWDKLDLSEKDPRRLHRTLIRFIELILGLNVWD